MEQKVYMISDAAKQVSVETHVLRYWEEELGLPIHRNKLGHRYYTADDINRLKSIKLMKEQGLQLKAIKTALRQEEEKLGMIYTKENKSEYAVASKTPKGRVQSSMQGDLSPEIDGEKAYRLQLMLKNIMLEAIREGNTEFCEAVKESVLKELDYQFRLQEERESERESERRKREEEHYKQIDAMIREKMEKNEKRKKHSFF